MNNALKNLLYVVGSLPEPGSETILTKYRIPPTTAKIASASNRKTEITCQLKNNIKPIIINAITEPNISFFFMNTDPTKPQIKCLGDGMKVNEHSVLLPVCCQFRC